MYYEFSKLPNICLGYNLDHNKVDKCELPSLNYFQNSLTLPGLSCESQKLDYSSSPDRISDHNIDAISPSTSRVAALRIQIGTNLKAVGRTRSETVSHFSRLRFWNNIHIFFQYDSLGISYVIWEDNMINIDCLSNCEGRLLISLE